MTFYQELQLSSAGSKQLIKNTTDKKEKWRHILIYNFKVYLVMAFCVAVVTLYTKLTGQENSVVGVTVLLALLVLRQADFGIRTSHGLLSIVGIFTIMMAGPRLANMVSPVGAFFINCVCILLLMIFGCHNVIMHNHSTFVLGYLLLYEDLWFRQMMLADEDTMSYNHAWGGTIPWPEDKWSGWYNYWIACNEDKRYYRYLKNEDGQFVGEIAYHYDAETQHEIADVIIYSKYRRKGYGSEALDLLCFVAKNNGISVLYDDIAIDNPAITLFLKHGFVEEYRTEEKIILKKEL
jgi:RimJ/RimL family protein N-acetyltransferase